MLNTTTKERMCDEIKRKDESIEEVSTKLFGDSKAISRWINNGRISIYNIYKMAMYFGVRMDYLLGLIDERLRVSSLGVPTEFYRRLDEIVDSKWLEHSKLTGMSQSAITRICKGEAIPTIDSMIKICTTLDVSCDWLFKTTDTSSSKVFVVDENTMNQVNSLLGGVTKRKHRNNLTLAQINALARKEHMTYGQYVSKYKL